MVSSKKEEPFSRVVSFFTEHGDNVLTCLWAPPVPKVLFMRFEKLWAKRVFSNCPTHAYKLRCFSSLPCLEYHFLFALFCLFTCGLHSFLLSQLRERFNVRIVIPSAAQEEKDIITVIGRKEDVEKAKVEIEKTLKDLVTNILFILLFFFVVKNFRADWMYCSTTRWMIRWSSL